MILLSLYLFLGKSLVFTGKIDPWSLENYCLPQKQGEEWVAVCRPLFDDKDHILYRMLIKDTEGLYMDSCEEYFHDIVKFIKQFQSQ